jgi:hypothetical protein
MTCTDAQKKKTVTRSVRFQTASETMSGGRRRAPSV